MQQPTGEQEAIAHTSVTLADALDDDRPFITLETVQDDGFDEAFEVFKEHVEDEEMVSRGKGNNEYSGSAENNEAAEWWQQPAVMPPVSKSNGDGQTVTDPAPAKPVPDALPVANVDDITPSTVRKTTASQRGDLPSWLIEQPTQSDMPRLRPSSLSNSDPGTIAPASKPSPAVWQPTVPRSRITEQLPRKQSTGAQKPLPKTTGKKTPSSPEWTPPEQETPSNGHLQSLSPSRETSGALPVEELREGDSPTLTKMGRISSQRVARGNYAALLAALQTLGYSITGFIATAVASLDGKPIAQVTMDDIDITRMCSYFSTILLGVLQSLNEGNGGDYEDMVITSANRRILLRIVGSNKDAFHVLITTRESEPMESLEVMANVEAALAAALQ